MKKTPPEKERPENTGPKAEENREAVRPGRALPALRRRHLWKRLRWLLWVLLVAPFIYLAVQIFIILAPRMRTDVVKLDTMTDSIEVRGLVVMDSVPVVGESGYMYYQVPTGQRVTAGAAVAQVFASAGEAQAMGRLNAIEQQLEQLANAQAAVAEGGDFEGLLAQMQSGLYTMVDGIERGDYTALDDARGDITLAANRIQISTGEVTGFEGLIAALTREKQRLLAQSSPVAEITAPQTGYFCPSQNSDSVQLSQDAADGITPLQLQQRLNAEPRYYGAEVVGHVVTDYKWRFFALAQIGESGRFLVGDKSLRLTFPDTGAEAPVVVQRVTEDADNGIVLVELLCEYVSPQVLSLREERAEIVFGVEKGIRIEKKALRLMDVSNGDGSVTTYQGVYVKFGNMVYFRRIEILVDDGNYMLVPNRVEDGVNEVRLYDEVVMDSGGVELYDRKIL